MKPMRVIQATSKAETKIFTQMIPKESHLRRPRKKDLKQAQIQKIMMKNVNLCITPIIIHSTANA